MSQITEKKTPVPANSEKPVIGPATRADILGSYHLLSSQPTPKGEGSSAKDESSSGVGVSAIHQSVVRAFGCNLDDARSYVISSELNPLRA
jgi:hypothetical protein